MRAFHADQPQNFRKHQISDWLSVMDWKLFAQLAVTLTVAVLGGWLGHYLSIRRDLAAERRKLRVSYLLAPSARFNPTAF
jgi:hypothetical protein